MQALTASPLLPRCSKSSSPLSTNAPSMFRSVKRLCSGAYSGAKSTVAMRPLGTPCTSSATSTPVSRWGLEPEPKASKAPAGQPGRGGKWARVSRSGLAFLRLLLSCGNSPSSRRTSVPGVVSAALSVVGSSNTPRCNSSSATTYRRWRTRTRPLAALRWAWPRGWSAGFSVRWRMKSSECPVGHTGQCHQRNAK
jgi:hypothetical protein